MSEGRKTLRFHLGSTALAHLQCGMKQDVRRLSDVHSYQDVHENLVFLSFLSVFLCIWVFDSGMCKFHGLGSCCPVKVGMLLCRARESVFACMHVFYALSQKPAGFTFKVWRQILHVLLHDFD